MRRSMAVAVALVVALILAGAPLRPAQATGLDPGITQLHGFLGQLGTWTSGLATVGRLAEPIPTAGRSAASVLGFPDLVQR